MSSLLMQLASTSSLTIDPYFANVSLLLHGDGTNGAQNNTFIDSSTNNFTITRYGNSTQGSFSPFSTTGPYDPSVMGGSGYFDGTGDRLQIASNTAFEFGTGDFTIECWAYPQNFGSTGFALYINWNGTGARFGIILVSTTVAIDTVQGMALSFSGTTTINLNTWYHVAVVRSGSSFKTYLNGTQVSSATSSYTYSPTGQPVSIGDYPDDYTTGYGYISSLRVVKGTAVYTSNFTPPTAPLTAITNTQLLLNFTNAGIFDNAMKADLETIGNARISTSVKKYGTGSIYFAGSGDWLSIKAGNQQFNLSSGDWTIECWVYVNSFTTTTSPHIWQIGTDVNNRYVLYREPTNGKFSFATVNSGTAAFANGTTTVATSTWYHVAVVRVSGVSRLYVNGTQEATVTSSINAGTTVHLGFMGFGTAAADYLNGYIDDLRVTKGVARYTANFTPPTAAFPNS